MKKKRAPFSPVRGVNCVMTIYGNYPTYDRARRVAMVNAFASEGEVFFNYFEGNTVSSETISRSEYTAIKQSTPTRKRRAYRR